MNNTGRFTMLMALGGLLFVSVAPAQSNQPAQTQTYQNSGISHPPPDSSIEADESAPPAPAPPAKPSAAIPATATTPAPATMAKAAPAPAAQAENPDYGIVTSVPAANEGTDSGVSLQKRAWNPDDDIVNFVPSKPNELAAGTNIRVRLEENLSTSETRPGTPFRATVDRDVYKDGRVIIPVGAEMRGRVVSVSQGHHLGPHATIRLRPELVMLPDGTAYHLYAEAVESKAAGTRTNDEGGIEASNHYKKDVVEYGAGTGVGAVTGAEIAGPVGAGVGSLVGAGVVTAHMLLQHPQQADLPQGSLLIFSLTEPMPLTLTKN